MSEMVNDVKTIIKNAWRFPNGNPISNDGVTVKNRTIFLKNGDMDKESFMISPPQNSETGSNKDKFDDEIIRIMLDKSI